MKLRNLGKLKTGGTQRKMTIGIPLPRTPEGRVYRYSPNEHAHPRHFVLGDRIDGFVINPLARSRMKLEPGSTSTVCPYSGTVAPDEAFLHPNDQKAALKVVGHAFTEDVADAVSDMFKGLARKSGNRGSLRFESRARKPKSKPRFGRRDLMRELICDHCGRDYGVFAIGLFCPDCGAPNVRLHFAREVVLVVKQVELAEGLGREEQELAYRLLGNAHEDVLTAFEATLKTVYLHQTDQAQNGRPIKPPKNDFQNVGKARERFGEMNFNPFSVLTDQEQGVLELNIHKRHVIGHNLGVADAKFVEQAADAKLGETVKLVGTDIRTFAAIGQKVIDGLDHWLTSANTGTIPSTASLPLEIVEEEMESDRETIGDLGPLATAVAKWICKTSEDGQGDPVDEDALFEAFLSSSAGELEEAIAELAADGLVTTTDYINAKLPRVRPTQDLFQELDPLVLGTSPKDDTLALVGLVLKGDGSVLVADLHKESGFPLRQFNPAVSMVIAEVGEGRVSEEGSPEYPARHFTLLPEDKVALRRLKKQLQG